MKKGKNPWVLGLLYLLLFALMSCSLLACSSNSAQKEYVPRKEKVVQPDAKYDEDTWLKDTVTKIVNRMALEYPSFQHKQMTSSLDSAIITLYTCVIADESEYMIFPKMGTTQQYVYTPHHAVLDKLVKILRDQNIPYAITKPIGDEWSIYWQRPFFPGSIE